MRSLCHVDIVDDLFISGGAASFAILILDGRINDRGQLLERHGSNALPCGKGHGVIIRSDAFAHHHAEINGPHHGLRGYLRSSKRVEKGISSTVSALGVCSKHTAHATQQDKEIQRASEYRLELNRTGHFGLEPRIPLLSGHLRHRDVLHTQGLLATKWNSGLDSHLECDPTVNDPTKRQFLAEFLHLLEILGYSDVPSNDYQLDILAP